MEPEEDREVRAWVQAHFSDPGNNRNLIAVLLRLQDQFGYLPKSGLRAVAEAATHFQVHPFSMAPRGPNLQSGDVR